jgi:glucan 1,3-beta-glucosidase
LAAAGVTVGVLIYKGVIKIHGSASVAASASGSSSGTSFGPNPGSPNKPGSIQPQPCTTASNIPSSSKGTWLDTTSWADMTDFNCTYTDQKVGDLPLVGLNSTWDDSVSANANVPPLNKPWGSYANKPFRGVSLGGWLSLEPFITPSLFDPDPTIMDEWSLCAKLGPKDAATQLEQHYSTFITEQDFKDIASAGLDHIRIPFSYWAVKTYDSDPYVSGISWRYLLRGIEWARKYGLRVKLDLHGVPGSQNGWNHSGKQGTIGWLNGPNGTVNAQRTLDIHSQLAKFFAQDRYKNIVVFYGLVNEPAASLSLDTLVTWTTQAIQTVKSAGFPNTQVFSESMRGLPPWAGKLQGYGDSLAIDVHLYTIFDNSVIGLSHQDRVNFACKTYLAQITTGMSTSNGFGPTIVGEWSQADTDCTKHLNGVGQGARWTGTFAGSGAPLCPTKNSTCDCNAANGDPSTFTDEYKTFLKAWAEAQMFAFERSWGWFYWTWKTENAPLWSYQSGLKAGIMPALAYQRDWDCSMAVPSFGNLPETY